MKNLVLALTSMIFTLTMSFSAMAVSLFVRDGKAIASIFATTSGITQTLNGTVVSITQIAPPDVNTLHFQVKTTEGKYASNGSYVTKECVLNVDIINSAPVDSFDYIPVASAVGSVVCN